MGLQAAYERFLQRPIPANFAENATLQYVTTLKSFKGGSKIVEHIGEQQQNVVKKKAEKIISVVEGSTAVVVIAETTLEFVSAGGAYLPGLDSFIIDRQATLPITHFVYFDQDDKITQIRLSWDQGDLLKQVEVIGKTGRNWPVFGGKDQIKMINASTSTANEVNPPQPLSPRGRNTANGQDRSASPSKKFIRDPHSSLDLSRPHEDERRPAAPNAVAPRDSARPPPRDMSDLFAAGHEDYEPTRAGGSPKKTAQEKAVAPKGAVHKKFQPSRLFGEDSPPKEANMYKTNPARYNHFDIGDYDANDSFQHRSENEKPKNVPIRPIGREHNSHFEFEDFITPEKVKHKSRDQDTVHFSLGDTSDQGQSEAQTKHHAKNRKDADTHFEFQNDTTPVHRPNVPKPRKDADNHFDFTDEATPGPRRIIARTQAASKLYHDPVLPNEEEERPLSTISHNARKDTTNQWENNDDSPAVAPKKQTAQQAGRNRNAKSDFWNF